MLTYERVSDGIDENMSAYERVGDGIDENSNMTSDDSNNNPTCHQHACPLKGLLKNTSTTPMTSSSPSGDDVRHKRKSVSFFDDVIVYLFDQDSPTRELQCHWSEPNGQTDNRSSAANRESPCPHLSCLAFTDSSSDVNGLEWEDDFSAFDTLDSSVTETNCQQTATNYTGWNNQDQPQGQQVLCSPQRWSTLSRLQSFTLSPSCLILTHVTESDLREF